MTGIHKGMCCGCPYNVGDEITENAYNWGCLPGILTSAHFHPHINTPYLGKVRGDEID